MQGLQEQLRLVSTRRFTPVIEIALGLLQPHRGSKGTLAPMKVFVLIKDRKSVV